MIFKKKIKDEEYYWKRTKACFIIAGIFAAIAVIGNILLLIIYIYEH